VQSGLIEFMLSCICVVGEIGRRPIGPTRPIKQDELDELRRFRDREMLEQRRGRRWADVLDRHSDELLGLLDLDAGARREAERILADGTRIVLARDSDHPPVIEKGLATRIDRLATHLERHARPQLREALLAIRKDTKAVAGKTAREAVR
jgi:hypothetical protein